VIKTARILFSALLIVSLGCFAKDEPKPEAKAEPEVAVASPQEKTKLSKSEAKRACRKEGKKGRDLKECIKSKAL
jgi:hypothetical protein